jgi:hypothetical protein
MARSKVQEDSKVEPKSKVDSVVYWLVQLAFAVAAVAGIKFYLQPVDPVLASVFAVSFVSLLFYITFKTR